MERKAQYRFEARFKKTFDDLEVERPTVRQVAPNGFVIVIEDPKTNIDYILSTTRTTDAPRIFTHLGRCVQVALRATGANLIHFELFPDSE